nr:DCC1-like thiol-disulfide oxidoreductase family protein [Pseudophaeobacter flagellatus]
MNEVDTHIGVSRPEAELPAIDLIVFDGECVLCSHFFRFMLRHDRMQRFFFATAQSELGQRLFRDLGLPQDGFDTMLVVVGGQTYQRLDAFAAAMRALPGGWPVLGICRFLPSCVKDLLYHAVARNRYRLFGRNSACLVPDADLQARFLDWSPAGAVPMAKPEHGRDTLS